MRAARDAASSNIGKVPIGAMKKVRKRKGKERIVEKREEGGEEENRMKRRRCARRREEEEGAVVKKEGDERGGGTQDDAFAILIEDRREDGLLLHLREPSSITHQSINQNSKGIITHPTNIMTKKIYIALTEQRKGKCREINKVKEREEEGRGRRWRWLEDSRVPVF